MSNLSQYLSPRDHRFKSVQRFIRKREKDIPTFHVSTIRETEHTTHLIDEMESIIESPNRYTVESTGEFWEKDFDMFYLERLSTYRMVQEWMKYPIGLAAEVWLAKQSFACPECGFDSLVLSGGSNAAWADLHCCKCKDVFIELKTKKNKAIQHIVLKKKMNAGSHRWYIAQERAGVKHYMVLLPKDGGNIYMSKILRAMPAVDNKFCAFYKESPHRATLRTELVIGSPKIIGKSDPVIMNKVELYGKKVVDRWISQRFGHYARIIQKRYRMYKYND